MDGRILAQTAAGIVVRMCRSLGLPRGVHRAVYQGLARRFGADSAWHFMNYGFDGAGFREQPLALGPEDEDDRVHIQLYHQVLADIPMDGATVLDVGCGRGGGAAYMHRYLGAKRVVGLDLSREGLRICARSFPRETLGFVNGDAEHLPFRDASFDVVINVESSHAYASMEGFVGEVGRVLRTGGFFAHADLRWVDRAHTPIDSTDLAVMRQQLQRCGLIVVRESDISGGVQAALIRGEQRWRSFTTRRVPRGFRRLFAEFAGLPGGFMYDRIKDGTLVYWSSVLRKPAPLHRAPNSPTIRADARTVPIPARSSRGNL